MINKNGLKKYFSNFDPVEEYSQDDTSNYDPAITHTLQNHAFLEFTFRLVYFSVEYCTLKIISAVFSTKMVIHNRIIMELDKIHVAR